jgi:hypothetical protein
MDDAKYAQTIYMTRSSDPDSNWCVDRGCWKYVGGEYRCFPICSGYMVSDMNNMYSVNACRVDGTGYCTSDSNVWLKPRTIVNSGWECPPIGCGWGHWGSVMEGVQCQQCDPYIEPGSGTNIVIPAGSISIKNANLWHIGGLVDKGTPKTNCFIQTGQNIPDGIGTYNIQGMCFWGTN